MASLLRPDRNYAPLSIDYHVDLAVAAAEGIAAKDDAAVGEALSVVVPVRVAAPAVIGGVPRAARQLLFLHENGLAKQGTKLLDNEIEQLMEAADADVNGLIDYDEFVTATKHMNKMDREEHLYTAFQFFDKDKTGYITRDEIKKAMKEKGMYDAKEIKEIISEADTVKRAVLIQVLEGRDLIARAKTGTEKTLA
ncbi:calcium-dependent protein kinase 17-like [Hordeum vulgare]|nr:calcium-dependent protein kinase 17-like [Hordeum vulgare]